VIGCGRKTQDVTLHIQDMTLRPFRRRDHPRHLENASLALPPLYRLLQYRHRNRLGRGTCDDLNCDPLVAVDRAGLPVFSNSGMSLNELSAE
jgi:hypothetical protein